MVDVPAGRRVKAELPNRPVESWQVSVNDKLDSRVTKTAGTRWRVRWRVARVPLEQWGTRAEMTQLRNSLQAAKARGELWYAADGKAWPSSMLGGVHGETVLQMAEHLIARRWSSWSAKYRYQRIAILAQLLSLLVDTTVKGAPDRHELRRVLDRVVLPPRATAHPLPMVVGGKKIVATEARVREVEAWVRAYSLPASGLTLTVVEDALWKASVKQDGRTYSTDPLTQQRVAMGLLCKESVKRGELAMSPMSTIDPVKKQTKARPIRKERVPTLEQARAIVTAVCTRKGGAPDPGRMKRYAAFLTLLWSTGARPSELAGLTLGPDVDLDGPRPSLTLRTPTTVGMSSMWLDDPSAGKTWEDRKHLKSRDEKETRRVPLTEEAADVLRTHLELNGTQPGARLFVNSKGQPLNPTNMAKAWRQGLHRGGLEQWEGLRPYDFRHVAATTWIEAGASLGQVAALLGNSSEVVARVYLSVTGDVDAAQRAVMERASAR